ncbi:MAG: radical SAM family heme chaperone HemW [Clostridia bacterium]|nr:radical SAM family heme chaperone HemW [Clostridia bacterium]
MLGLYIHIPFCVSKCIYCDFVSFGGRQELLPPYLSALKNEAERYKGKRISSVFIGGGTPSLMSENQITGLCDFLHKNFRIDADAEFSMEANPQSLTVDKLKAAKNGGVNRISLGAQSLSDKVLCSLGRCHDRLMLEKAIENVKKTGFDNFNLDLIFALPEQTAAMWEQTLKDALSFQPKHISCYSLIVDENTPLGKMYAEGKVTLISEEEEREMYYLTNRILHQNGIEQYEISNYASPGFECKHNVNYWECGEYIGLGCAAHSYFNGARFSNTVEMEKYISQKDIVEQSQTIDKNEQMDEKIIFGIRMNRGISLKEFNDLFKVDFEQRYNLQIQKNLKRGFILIENGFLRLTDKGRDFCDTVALDFIQ